MEILIRLDDFLDGVIALYPCLDDAREELGMDFIRKGWTIYLDGERVGEVFDGGSIKAVPGNWTIMYVEACHALGKRGRYAFNNHHDIERFFGIEIRFTTRNNGGVVTHEGKPIGDWIQFSSFLLSGIPERRCI